MNDKLMISKEISPSLREAMEATGEALQRQRTILGIQKRELADQDKKIEIAKSLNLPLGGFRSWKTRLTKKIDETTRTISAYLAGYLEIPDFGDEQEIKRNDDSGWAWRISLPGSVPLRVLKAVKQADESGFFKKLAVVQRGADPIVVGIVGGIRFYITSWK